MKSKAVLLALFAGFLALFACTNPIMEQARERSRNTPTLEIPQTLISYTVAFESNGGSAVDSQIVTEGDTASRPDNPTQDGYGFVNWYDNAGLAEPHYDFGTPVTADITLYAKWSSITYTVTFNSNGGSAVAAQIVGENGTASRPVPTKDGYAFDDWYSDPALTALYDFDTPVTGNIDLYAKWIPLYTVSFDSNGGSPVPSQTVTEGDTAIRPDNPTQDGYDFVNWYNNGELSAPPYDFDTPVTGNITLYAKWKLTTEMVWINPGTFMMGSPANEAGRDPSEIQHRVTLSGFYMGKYPVTQAQYEAVMGSNPSYFKTLVSPETSTAKRPVENVSWYDAIVFCNRLSMQEGLYPAYRINGSTDPDYWGSVPTNWDSPTKGAWDAVQIVAGSDGYRLPTEAQWEYACRAGTTTAYNTGDTISDNTGWYENNSGGRTHEVGLKTPNAYGLYDMHGNVWEWCWDWYGDYASGEQEDPTGAVSGHDRVIRGGSFEMPGPILRSAVRFYPFLAFSDADMGFRLARLPPAVTYTVTFDLGGGSPADVQIVIEGKKLIRPPNPEKSGFDFDNWYSNSALTVLFNFDVPVTGNITLYAKWKVTIEGMVWIPAGTFLMGSPANEPNRESDETRHQVTLTKGFYMGKYPVTQAEYEAVMETNPSQFKAPVSPETSTANRPVEYVRWYEAVVFCNKLSMQKGLSPAYTMYRSGAPNANGGESTWTDIPANWSTDPADWGTVPTSSSPRWNTVRMVEDSSGYRLPTEAQWEYACRAGTTTAYYTGATISDETGWYNNNSGNRTQEVGLKPPNSWGLYDMHGNVGEWCWDSFGDYAVGPQTDPTGAASVSQKIYRGGSWREEDQYLRSAFRNRVAAFARYNDQGFRVVRP